ncbi:MAG: hypothetical protein FWG09_03960 [Synergistaceae bacterium]|nr:hypothetical protein [Synergistaceae bacterium]
MKTRNKLKKCFIVGICFLLIMIPERLAAFLYIPNYLLDRFLESIKTLEIPSYTLAEDFPQEHVKTFNDFLLFCASIEETRRFSKKPDISVVKARLELNNPVRYEDFLASVPFSVAFVGHDSRMFEQRSNLIEHYVEIFRFPSRNSFFIENILEPLSDDLKNKEYRGYRFKDKNLPQFFREFFESARFGRRISYTLTIKIEEIFLANYYAQTFLLIHNEKLREAYKEMYRYKIPLSILEKRQFLPPRPYYFYSDEDRYLWFEYLQSELRDSGHADYADEVLQTELEHYRELINWQLQLRAYLAQKLYEYGDKINLSTLKEWLKTEYIDLKNDPLLQTNFEMAIETLRDMDDRIRTSQISAAKGNLTLPWIDREAIDHKQGIKSEILSIYPEPITWKTLMERIDDETKEEMKNSYERSIYCIRALAVISESLYFERDLKTMTLLHSKLVSNKDVSCTPTGISHQDFSAKKNTFGDGEKFPELDIQTRLNLRRYGHIAADDLWGHRIDNKSNDKNIKYMSTGAYNQNFSAIKNTYWNEEFIPKLSTQTRLDLRRYDLIANDFWGHQARRKNGDMTVGDIILPWVEVPNEF